ncbi:hypothetical protein EK904_007971 [Melospiza melodia maxima]|nr:hypothetical protein EK904_007971 [Melospiza melodia maxima]
MCILSALFYFPSLHAALVSRGLCFFGGIWLVLASSTDWAFGLERLVPCKGMKTCSCSFWQRSDLAAESRGHSGSILNGISVGKHLLLVLQWQCSAATEHFHHFLQDLDWALDLLQHLAGLDTELLPWDQQALACAADSWPLAGAVCTNKGSHIEPVLRLNAACFLPFSYPFLKNLQQLGTALPWMIPPECFQMLLDGSTRQMAVDLEQQPHLTGVGQSRAEIETVPRSAPVTKAAVVPGSAALKALGLSEIFVSALSPFVFKAVSVCDSDIVGTRCDTAAVTQPPNLVA